MTDDPDATERTNTTAGNWAAFDSSEQTRHQLSGESADAAHLQLGGSELAQLKPSERSALRTVALLISTPGDDGAPGAIRSSSLGK